MQSSSELTMGVIGSSFKENEHRVPIHPKHFESIDPALRRRIYLERGYGARFGGPDEACAKHFAGLRSRDELMASSDIVLLPKPTARDLPSFREGQIVWGWPHCVQGPAITQTAIDKRLTLIAWEAMHKWRGDNWELHIFHINNELAGYCGVLHALQLRGLCGHYGPYLKAAVIGFGSVGRGAIHALHALGYHDVTLFTQRTGPTVSAPIPSLKHWRYQQVEAGQPETEVVLTRETMPMARALGHFDIVVACALQDTDNPHMYVKTSEIDELREGTLIVDVSCDEAMGFEFARPTSFESPSFPVGDGRVTYYAVDHTPSYLWNSTSLHISKALLPYIPTVMGGPAAWERDSTIARAIEIQDGVIKNPKILSFQRRAEAYPHAYL